MTLEFREISWEFNSLNKKIKSWLIDLITEGNIFDMTVKPLQLRCL